MSERVVKNRHVAQNYQCGEWKFYILEQFKVF